MKFKRMFALLLLAMGLIVANAAEAVGSQGPPGKQGKVGPKGDTGQKGDTGPLNPLSPIITCGDSIELVGGWKVMVNGVASKSTQECLIRADSSGNLTGSCQDIQNNNSFIISSGSSTFNNQCVVSLTITFTNGAIATSRSMINKAGDTLIGTYKNSLGDYGTFSGILQGG